MAWYRYREYDCRGGVHGVKTVSYGRPYYQVYVLSEYQVTYPGIVAVLYLCTNTICIIMAIHIDIVTITTISGNRSGTPPTHSAFTPQCPNSYLSATAATASTKAGPPADGALTFQHYADNSQTPLIAFVSDSSLASSTLIARVLPPFHPPDSLALCFPWGGQGAMTPGRHVPARGRLAPCPGCTVISLRPPPAQQ